MTKYNFSLNLDNNLNNNVHSNVKLFKLHTKNKVSDICTVLSLSRYEELATFLAYSRPLIDNYENSYCRKKVKKTNLCIQRIFIGVQHETRTIPIKVHSTGTTQGLPCKIARHF